MRQPVLVRAIGDVLAVSPAAALAATTARVGSFSSEDQFIIEPGDIASCSAPGRGRPATVRHVTGLAERAGLAGEAAGGAALDRYRHHARQIRHRARRVLAR